MFYEDEPAQDVSMSNQFPPSWFYGSSWLDMSICSYTKAAGCLSFFDGFGLLIFNYFSIFFSNIYNQTFSQAAKRFAFLDVVLRNFYNISFQEDGNSELFLNEGMSSFLSKQSFTLYSLKDKNRTDYSNTNVTCTLEE